MRLSISNPFTTRRGSSTDSPKAESAYDRLKTKRSNKNFAVKQGTILPTMSGTFKKGANSSAIETKLNDTRIELLKVLRERHEHAVDKFLTGRTKLRALIGLNGDQTAFPERQARGIAGYTQTYIRIRVYIYIYIYIYYIF